MAHVPAHLFDATSERGNGIQGDAGVVATFLTAIDLGRLHSGDHSVKACCPGRRNVARSVSARNPTCSMIRHPIAGGNQRKKGAKGTQIYVLLHPLWFPPIPHNIFGMYGGDDGARTRDLCRDSIQNHPKSKFSTVDRTVKICVRPLLHTGETMGNSCCGETVGLRDWFSLLTVLGSQLHLRSWACRLLISRLPANRISQLDWSG